MTNKNCSKKKDLVNLDLQKFKNTPHSIVAGEARANLFYNILKIVDKCDVAWKDCEKEKVAEGIGLVTATYPIAAFTSVGTVLNNAAFNPLGRLFKIKGGCKKKDNDEADVQVMNL